MTANEAKKGTRVKLNADYMKGSERFFLPTGTEGVIDSLGQSSLGAWVKFPRKVVPIFVTLGALDAVGAEE